jgi:cell wall-associated NlpC family hydrolase
VLNLKAIKKKFRQINIVQFLITALIFIFIINSLILFYQDQQEVKIPTDDEIVQHAMLYLQDKDLVKLGNKLDCSGFTHQVFIHFGIKIPVSSIDQLAASKRLPIDELGKGDLVFFNTNGKHISHVGIYLCDNKFIHSPGKYSNVRVDSLNFGYWKDRFVCGGSLKSISNSLNLRN